MTPQAHLCRLLLDCFEPDEFRRLLASRAEFQAILDELPGGHASASMFFHEAVLHLERRGLVDRAFFDILRAERPRRAGEIDKIETFWPPGSAEGRDGRTVTANRLVEYIPIISAVVAFPVACAIAWRRPNHALIFAGLYLCIVAPWSLRERVLVAVALVCGSGLLLGGAILTSVDSRRFEPQPA